MFAVLMSDVFSSLHLVEGIIVFGYHLLALFPGNVVQAVAHHVDDTELDLSVGESAAYLAFTKNFPIP